MKRAIALMCVVFSAVGCGNASGLVLDDLNEKTDLEADLIGGRVGAVFTMSNDAASNEVLSYRRAADGSLQLAARYPTTGKGAGNGLGSQGALILSESRRQLYAVNAGSNELSVFSVQGESLFLLDIVATGGIRPVSVAEKGGLVYVVHAGADRTELTGFIFRSGRLNPLPKSTRALSSTNAGPAQVSFSPSGRALVVTEKATNKIAEFRVDPQTGLLNAGTFHDSKGQTPFGFAVTRRAQLVVSEAFGGAADASAMSSYQLGASAGLTSVSASVKDTESAACWVVLAQEDRFAYTSNTGSGTISAYTVSTEGRLALVGVDGRNAFTGDGSRPLDMAVSRGDRFLYVLEGGTAATGAPTAIGVLRIEQTGTLTVLPDVAGLPATSVGLVAF
jgi:6-phosphogluconolactonase (cycloisomerase 2 family)